MTINNISEFFLRMAGTAIERDHLLEASRDLLLSVSSFDDDVDFIDFLKKRGKRMEEDRFTNLLKMIVSETSRLSTTCNFEEVKQKRLQKFGRELAECLSEHKSQIKELPDLKLPEGSISFLDASQKQSYPPKKQRIKRKKATTGE